MAGQQERCRCCARLVAVPGLDAVPQHNMRLFDEMQAHQLLIPCEDKAIWHCRIEASGGWSSELTLLRFSPSLIWEDPQQRPATFIGTVTPIAEIRNETEAVIATNIEVEQPSLYPNKTKPHYPAKPSGSGWCVTFRLNIWKSMNLTPESIPSPGRCFW